ncbi:hypothetical protein PAMP_004369 [Pampus punctatissimus]
MTSLSHNRISVLDEESFRNLPFLHTLLLDHNLLTSQALQGGALTNLTQLEVLALGHNLISMIQAGWLKGTKALRSLKLEGNLLTSLDSGSFPLNDLRDLESLDVSDNRINHLDRNSWLTNLNLDLNSWNCSCELLELAAFLSTFIQQPDQTLYNGRRMVCVSADNPAVTTVLELTEANCVPSNQNITVQIQTKGSVMPQLYARDLAITAVICFIGGVGLTLLAVLIYYQVSRRKKLKESEGQREKEDGSSTVANHLVNHHDISEKRRDLFLQANSSQPWDKEAVMLDTRIEGHGSHFRCPDCSAEGPRLRWENRINGGMESEEDRERRRMRMMMMEEERRKPGTHQEILSRDVPNKLLSNSSSHPWRDTLSQRPETLVAYKTHREMGESCRTGVEGKNRGQETTNCESCHRTYRPSQGRFHANMRDSALFDSFLPQYRLSDRGRNVNYSQFDMMKDTDLRRGTRNVTFNLENSRTRKEEGNNPKKGWREEEAKTSRDKERGRERKHKAKVPSSRLLKVKLNLNPLRKSKVHPKRKTEQGHLEKSSSKKSKEKRQDGKERGEKEGEGSSGKKTKGSSEKMKKSKELMEGDEEEKEDEEGEQKGKSSSKQKKNISKSGKDEQESAEGDQGEKTQHTSSDTVNTADQSHSARAEETSVTGQGPGLQGVGIQYQGAGLVLGSTQLSSQHHFSLSASERTRTTNRSLAGSQLTGSNLSLQGGNFLLNTTVPMANVPYPSGPANTIAPSIAISGPKMVLSGGPDSVNKQAEVGLMSPATSLLANTVHANPLQASVIQTTALYNSQPGGFAQNLAANPAINPAPIQSLAQSQMPPDSSPLITQLKLDPAQRPGLTGDRFHQLPPGSQANESFTLPTQAPQSTDGSSKVTPQVLGPVTTVENVSNNNSQTEDGRVPGGSTVSMSAGGVAVTEGPAVRASAAADVSVSGVSAQSRSSTGSPVAAATLLQQEYLPEDGGSSPRRKLRLVLPEKVSSRPPTALERKIR